MNDEFDEIEELLADYKIKKKHHEDHFGSVEPPKRREDTSLPTDDPSDGAENPNDTVPAADGKKKRRTLKQAMSPLAWKGKRVSRKLSAQLKSDRGKKAAKAVVAVIVVIGLVTGAGFGINEIIKSARNSYLIPYENKYGISFPEGILEEYCDIYGENQNAAGVLKIDDNEFVVSTDQSEFPYLDEGNSTDLTDFNTVIYGTNAQLGFLEEMYATADGFNQSSQYITFDSLFKHQSWRVIGAFYTNTKSEDDNGYIFPYNVTEEMTVESYNNFADRLDIRFLYDTQTTVTRADQILTISIDTNYYKNFRFVVVCIRTNNTNNKRTAEEKTHIRYPQAIFDRLGLENTYQYAAQWYPEIVLSDGSTKQQTVNDYD